MTSSSGSDKSLINIFSSQRDIEIGVNLVSSLLLFVTHLHKAQLWVETDFLTSVTSVILIIPIQALPNS